MTKDVIHDWLKVTGRRPVLPESQVIQLTRKIQDPNTLDAARRKAVNTLVTHNLRIVVKVVVPFLKLRGIKEVSDDRISDYLQQGVFGLIRAAEKFDPTKGYKFTTYSYRWVRQSIGRYHYRNYSLIYVPENTLTAMLNDHLNRTKPELVEAARQVCSVDSLDRFVGNGTTLGDIVSETCAV